MSKNSLRIVNITLQNQCTKVCSYITKWMCCIYEIFTALTPRYMWQMAQQIAHVSSYSYNIEIIIMLTEISLFSISLLVLYLVEKVRIRVGCTVLIIVLHEATNWKHIYSLLPFLCYDVSVIINFTA